MTNTNEKEWWYNEHLIGLYGAMFECGDYEGLVEKIRKIVAEADRRGRVAAWEEAVQMAYECANDWVETANIKPPDVQAALDSRIRGRQDVGDLMQRKIAAKLSTLSNSQEKV